jgi:hypothetical protein
VEAAKWMIIAGWKLALCYPNSNSDPPVLLLKACPSNRRSGYKSTQNVVVPFWAGVVLTTDWLKAHITAVIMVHSDQKHVYYMWRCVCTLGNCL